LSLKGKTDYLEFNVTGRCEELAKLMIESAPAPTKRSFMKGAGVYPGCYGEAGVITSLGTHATSMNTVNHDILFEDQRLEIKTKATTYSRPPELHYECSLVDYIAGKQDCDFYVFTRVYKENDKFLKGWILGYISPEEYMNKAQFMKKGQFDSRNNYTVRNDCYNLEIKELHPIAELLW